MATSSFGSNQSLLQNVPGVQREPWESRYHWLCRRKFIEDHKNMYSFQRTVCLSMVWANMNFLETNYSKDVEQSVSYYPVPEKNEVERWLSAHTDVQKEAEKGLMKERQHDEASNKIMGKRTLSDSEPQYSESVSNKIPKMEPSDTNESTISHQLSEMISSLRQQQDGSTSTGLAGQATDPSSLPDSVPSALKSDPKWKKTLKFLSCWCLCSKCYAGDTSNHVSSLHWICQKSKIQLEFFDEKTHDGAWCVTAVIDNVRMSMFTAATKKSAKIMAAGALMNEIKQRQIEIQFECPATGRRVINLQDIDRVNVKEEKISDSNKGHQMLRKMGWKEEEGLGTMGQGQREPVTASTGGTFRDQRGREGFGQGLGPQSGLSRENVRTMLQEFMTSNETQLEFSPDLSNEDRKTVHNLSEQYNLHHKSIGSGASRFLVVSKKTSSDGSNRHGHVPGGGMEYGGSGTGPMRHRNVPPPWHNNKPYSRF